MKKCLDCGGFLPNCLCMGTFYAFRNEGCGPVTITLPTPSDGRVYATAVGKETKLDWDTVNRRARTKRVLEERAAAHDYKRARRQAAWLDVKTGAFWGAVIVAAAVFVGFLAVLAFDIYQDTRYVSEMREKMRKEAEPR